MSGADRAADSPPPPEPTEVERVPERPQQDLPQDRGDLPAGVSREAVLPDDAGSAERPSDAPASGGAGDAGDRAPGVRPEAVFGDVESAETPHDHATGDEPLEHTTYSNRLPEQFQADLEDAERLGAEPMSPDDPRFDELRQQAEAEAEPLNYVVTEQGELIVGPSRVGGKEIRHSVLADGEPVRAAGQVDLAGNTVTYIDNDSGHYQPSADSLTVATDSWERAGFTVWDRAAHPVSV